VKNSVLITGCSSGVGRASAFYFQTQGWRVAATMRNPEKETALTSLTDVFVDSLDVTSKDSIDCAIENALKEFHKIDVLVNNAGIGFFSVFEETEESVIRDTFETNIFGTMWVTQACLPHFRKNRQGTIINVISTIPQIGLPLTTLYCATKMAVEGLSHALYFELLPFGIKVKLVQPGSTRTSIAMQHDPPDEPLIDDYGAMCTGVTQWQKQRYETGEADPPEEVAKVIFKAATTDSSRYRYLSSRDAKVFNLLLRVLPEHTIKNLALKMIGRENLGF